MRSSKQLRVSVGLLAVMFLSACATTETMIAAPTVQLKTVELSKVSFNQQTFLLGFGQKLRQWRNAGKFHRAGSR